MKKDFGLFTCIALINLLFIYASVTKWIEWYLFTHNMHSLPVPYWFSTLLIWLLPPLEIISGLMLFVDKYRLLGFIITTSLMFTFSVYAFLAVIGWFDRYPCACGGAISSLTWPQHLVLNTVFLIISGCGLLLTVKVKPTSVNLQGLS